MRASKNALDLVKQFESCRLYAYEDQGGVWTVGWGTTGPGINERTSVSQGIADAMLKSDIAQLGEHITPLVGLITNQDQFDALVSLVYNIGITAFKNSTMLKKIRAHDLKGAAEEFDKWVHVHKVVSDGLVRRRKAEKALFSRKLVNDPSDHA